MNLSKNIRRRANEIKRTRKRRTLLRLESLEQRQLLAADFSMQLLHASDLEGGVDAIENSPNFSAIVEGLEDDAADDGIPSILLSAGDNYIPGPFFNAAGDRAAFRDSGLFNDVYNELFGVASYDSLREGNGRVDVSIMNVLGFDASAVGNHEFDAGSDAFESIIEEDFQGAAGPADDRWVGAQFPYLSANLDFSGDADLSNLFTADILPNTEFSTGPAGSSSAPKIAQATTIVAGSELIGVVGATTQLINSISSPSGTVDVSGGTVDMDALAAALQPVIDDLANGDDDLAGNADDVNKIVLVSHLQQIELEKTLAEKLDGVDIIVAGGSDTILANGDDTLLPGEVAGDSYPILTSDLSANPTVIVSTAGEYSYVGQLTVGFNNAGILVDSDNVVVDELSDFDPTKNGPVAATDASVEAIWGNLTDPFAVGSKAEKVQRLVDAVTGVVIATDGNIFGKTDVFLDGRRENVRTQETNMGNATADANLFVSQVADPTVEVSLKNGGGIRAPIGEIDGFTGALLPPQGNPAAGKAVGDISQLDIENSLRFNNGLTLLTVTSNELKVLLEHSVAGTEPGATPGQFAQIGGMKFSFDPDGTAVQFNSDADIAGGAPLVATAGTRVRNVALTDADGQVNEVLVQDGVVLNPGREVRMVTLDFLFGIFSSSPNFGGDGYPFPAFAENVVQLKDAGLATGAADFADAGSEQDAFAEYLVSNYPSDNFDSFDEKPSYNAREVRPELDLRIQNLSERSDTVLPVAGRKVVVSNGYDSGPGSLREAIHVANDNPNIRKIVVKNRVNAILVETAVEYTGQQDLTILGRQTIITASDTFIGEGVFVSSGGADLTVRDLTIDGDWEGGEAVANGIYVPVPVDAKGVLSIALHDVNVINSGLFGVWIADQINNSDASIQLDIKDSRFINNGIGELDADGMRVDEGGLGDIVATIKNSRFDANGADGLELDERDTGDVVVEVKDSTFNENGFFNIAVDPDDGFDIDEAGAGSIFVAMKDVEANDNDDEGVDFDEADAGSVYLEFNDVEANNNADEGIKITEDEDSVENPTGSIVADFEEVTASGNGGDGIKFEEFFAGSIWFRLEDVTTHGNDDEGIQIEELGGGSVVGRLKDIESNGNADSGLQITENESGNLLVSVEDSELEDNGGVGIAAEELGQGLGLLALLDDVELDNNLEGELDLVGVLLLGGGHDDDDDDDDDD